jgi:hypothetical protein
VLIENCSGHFIIGEDYYMYVGSCNEHLVIMKINKSGKWVGVTQWSKVKKILGLLFLFFRFLFSFFSLVSFFLLVSFIHFFFLLLSFFFLSFIHFSSFSFNIMEALPSLALGPPSSLHFCSIPRTIHGPFGVSLSLGGRGGAFCNIPCFGCGVLFSQCGMVRH